jgi:hypothetical protein
VVAVVVPLLPVVAVDAVPLVAAGVAWVPLRVAAVGVAAARGGGGGGAGGPPGGGGGGGGGAWVPRRAVEAAVGLAEPPEAVPQQEGASVLRNEVVGLLRVDSEAAVRREAAATTPAWLQGEWVRPVEDVVLRPPRLSPATIPHGTIRHQIILRLPACRNPVLPLPRRVAPVLVAVRPPRLRLALVPTRPSREVRCQVAVRPVDWEAFCPAMTQRELAAEEETRGACRGISLPPLYLPPRRLPQPDDRGGVPPLRLLHLWVGPPLRLRPNLPW